MDKKTLIGLIVIGAILFGFTWYNASIQQKYAQEQQALTATQETESTDTIVPEVRQPDTLQAADQLERHIGSSLFQATTGTEKKIEVENDLMKVIFSNKGGKVASVVLKDYLTYQGTPLVLFPDSASVFDMSFFIKQQFNNVQINTGNYYFVADSSFTPTFAADETSKNLTFRLDVDSAAHVDFVYTIYKDNYMIDFDVQFVGMENLLAQNQTDLEFTWQNVGMQNEKGFENENNYTTIAYKYPSDESVEQLRTSTEDKSETINSKVKWVAFKQQFFSSIFVAKDDFQNGTLGYSTFQPGEGKIKTFRAKVSVPFTPQLSEYNFNFYFGPNKFSVLKKYDDLHFERLIPLGGWIVGWINRWLVIPTFDTLGAHIANYGIIILILTLIVKILISPLTYKSYLSSAKMRLLKPEVDKLNEKYPKPEDALKKQQAMMALYKSAGVNPMGGCLPLLIQLPILYAMFRFFPASIELRGEHFLWADDLSSYDSILTLPFNIPFYGNHVSLFALLMAASMFIYSRINYNQTAGSAPQMAGMKFMMLYLMPIMMLFFFNNFASGLNYYYLLSNIITIGQTYGFRYIVNEDKLHQRMKENAKKPQKKSKWQQRYEEMVKLQQQQAAARAKQQRR
jgi:YidC/Oxa1 family membrane protein insertase